MPLTNDTKRKRLIVLDNDYYPIIFLYKNKNPNENIKIINKGELLDKVGYRYSKDPLPFLIKEKGISYSKGKKIINLIKYLRGIEDNPYKELIEDIKDYLTIDEYGLYELNQYDIELLELDEDKGLLSLLDRFNISYKIIHLSDLNIKETNTLKKPNIIYFNDKFLQFSYIFSDIKKRIKDDENVKNNIKILIKDNDDLFYIQSIAKLFDIDIYYNYETSLSINPFISNKINEIYNSRSLKFDINEDDNDDIKTLYKIIKDYRLDEIEDFNVGYLNLVEIINSKKDKILIGDKGIKIVNSFSFVPSDIIYVTNFEYGSFYKESADNNALSDSLLFKLNLSTSFNKTALDKRKKLNYLKYNNIVLLSRVKQHLTDSIYDSHFCSSNSLFLSKEVKEFDKIEEINYNGLFTSKTKSLLTAHRYDQLFYYDQVDEYRSYDHSFKGVNANELMVKEKWSITNLERYIDCPFKYYLDELFKLPGDFHHAYRGTLIHAVMEDIMHSDFDFEKSFSKGVDRYKSQMEKNKEEFTKKEELWIEIYKYWLSNMVPSLLRMKDHMNLIEEKEDNEIKIEFDIDKYHFKGVIDKIIYTENNNEIFYTIVDYKSGKESYDDLAIAVGKSIQLPLYYYAIISQKDDFKYTKNGTFGGFAIQHNYFKTIKEAYVDVGKVSEARFLNNIKLSGIANSDESYWKSFDKTAFSEDKGFDPKKAKFLSNKLQFTTGKLDTLLLSNKNIVDTFSLDNVINISKKAALRTIKAIKNNQFDIAPSSLDISKPLKLDNLSCKYCDHRNICYVNPIRDAKDYSSYIKNEIKKEASSNE